MNPEPTTLITTKLHRPPVAGDLVQRPRLLEELNHGLSRPLTLVCAGAGFGKTTLISSWLGENVERETRNAEQIQRSAFRVPRFPYAWLSLDEHDSDLGIFLRYFVAAVRTVFAGACVQTQELIHARQLPPMDLLAATLINEIARLPRPFVLALDDFNSIQGEDVHELLRRILQHWPQTLHLVLITRRNPPLPLARLRTKGQMNEIRSGDLRFTHEEMAAYLEKAMPAPLSLPALSWLEERTEGWIAGLQLATLSLRSLSDDKASPEVLSRADFKTGEYLIDEVLASQPPVIQRFLLRTSILDRFCAPLCEAVARVEEPEWSVKTCMDWIDHANLFVVALDNRQEWYRYHHLFQEMVQQRLREGYGPDEVSRLHRTAAGWFAERGLVEEALHHALAAGDLDLAAKAMEQGLCVVLNRTDRPTLERWLHLLPDEFIQQRPQMLMVKAWSLELAWQLEAQARILQRVEALVADDGTSALSADELRIVRGQLLTFYGQTAFFRNEPARAVALCHEALSLLPSSWTYVRGGAMLYWGLAMQASGQGRAAERLLLDEYAAHADEVGGYAPRLLMALCFIFHQEGQLEQVERTAQQLLQQATQSGLVVLRSWAHYFLGVVCYRRNELDVARQHFDAVIQSRHVTLALIAAHSYFGLVLTQQARGETTKANQTLHHLSQFDLESRGAEEERTRSLRARLMLLRRDLEGASRWADAFNSPPRDQPLHWLEEPHVTKARILLARGDHVDVQLALDILDALLGGAQRTCDNGFQIEILALRALALEAQGKSEDALSALQQAVELSRPGGFIRTFVDLGPDMQAMLSHLVGQSFAVATVERILAAFPDGEAGVKAEGGAKRSNHRPSQKAGGLVEPLTARELEILALMREPLGGKEVAKQLYISYATFKRHASNIYGKFGVSSRWEAVAAAETLGILPPP